MKFYVQFVLHVSLTANKDTLVKYLLPKVTGPKR